MSYLATLTRPVDSTPQAKAPQAPVPAAEPSGEVQQKVDAAPPRAALPAPAVDRPSGQAASIPFEAPAPVGRPVANAEQPAWLPALLHAAPAEKGKSASMPVEHRSAPAELDRLASTTDVLLPNEAPSHAPRGAGEMSPTIQPQAAVATTSLSTRSVPDLLGAKGSPRRAGDHDQAAHEHEHLPEHATTRLPASSLGRSDSAVDRATARASSGRAKTSVHIGAISLTVKTPTAPPPLAAPVIAPATQALPPAASSRSREGLGFSASRHYLRWN